MTVQHANAKMSLLSLEANPSYAGVAALGQNFNVSNIIIPATVGDAFNISAKGSGTIANSITGPNVNGRALFIYNNNSGNITVIESKFEGSTMGTLLQADNTSNLSFTSSNFSGAGFVYMASCNNLNLTSNQFSAGANMMLISCSSPVLSHNAIASGLTAINTPNIKFINNQGIAWIQVEESNGVTITNNTFTGEPPVGGYFNDGMDLVSCSNMAIIGNTITASGSAAHIYANTVFPGISGGSLLIANNNMSSLWSGNPDSNVTLSSPLWPVAIKILLPSRLVATPFGVQGLMLMI